MNSRSLAAIRCLVSVLDRVSVASFDERQLVHINIARHDPGSLRAWTGSCRFAGRSHNQLTVLEACHAAYLNGLQRGTRAVSIYWYLVGAAPVGPSQKFEPPNILLKLKMRKLSHILPLTHHRIDLRLSAPCPAFPTLYMRITHQTLNSHLSITKRFLRVSHQIRVRKMKLTR